MTSSELMWIGLRREPGSKDFRWSDGSPLTYTNWASGEPKMRWNELCVAQNVGRNSTWTVFDCKIRRWFVCKMLQANIPVSPDVPTAEPIPSCHKPDTPSWETWNFYQGYCYYFHVPGKFSWDAAKTYCQDNGAFLASVHSFEEYEFLFRAVPHTTGMKDFWTGLRAKGLRSSYHWDDGTPVDFVNWDGDFREDDKTYIDTCVSINMMTGRWHKNHCNQLSNVICKSKNGTDNVFTTAAPTPSWPGFCPDEWYTFGNKCYKIFGFADKDTWPGAKRKCSEIGSSLVTVHSREEQDFLSLLVLNLRSETWIGMYSTIGGRLFHWTDNSSLDYTNWDSDEPNYTNEEEECVHMVFSFTSSLGKWNDHRCTMRFSYICEIPKDPMLASPGLDAFSCAKPEGWLKLGSSCYKIVNDSDMRLTWIQAQSYCLSVAGNLASVANSGVSLLLLHHLNQMQGLFWIGMRDMGKRKYAWLGTSPLKYTNWLRDQPQQVSDLHNCVAMNTEGKWMVRHCDESLPFICEEKAEHPTVAPLEPQMICPNSSRKWRDFGGKVCYIIEVGNSYRWPDAAHHCFQEGGYLASFHSAEEVKVIQHYIKDADFPLHIGLSRKEDGGFGWLDGSAVDYVNWAPGEPNDPQEMCAEMHSDDGTWNDIACKEFRGYICSTKKVPAREDSGTASKSTEQEENLRGRVAAGGIAGILICILVVLAIAAVASYYFCPCTRMRTRPLSEPSSP